MQSGKPGAGVRPALVALVIVFLVSACATLGASDRSGSRTAASVDLATLPPDTFELQLGASLPSPAASTVPGSSQQPGSGSGSAASMAPASPVVEVPVEKEPKKKPKPKVKTIRLKPRPKPGPFSMNLYRKGAFVHQQTKDWCVAGSTQTMMNIMDKGRPDRSAAFQKRLYLKGRRLSPNKAKLGPIGVDLTGWAELLNTGGYGPYEVDGARSRKAAIRMAARALRKTGRPVGLVVWRGAHSWVMSGFRATADPAYSKRFKVTSVFIQDVWYPYVSTIWGASRPPDSRVPVSALGQDFLRYDRPGARHRKRDGKFMLILPVLPRNTVVR